MIRCKDMLKVLVGVAVINSCLYAMETKNLPLRDALEKAGLSTPRSQSPDQRYSSSSSDAGSLATDSPPYESPLNSSSGSDSPPYEPSLYSSSGSDSPPDSDSPPYESPLNSSSDSDSPTPKSLKEQLKDLLTAADGPCEKLYPGRLGTEKSKQTLDTQATGILTQEVASKAAEKERESQAVGPLMELDIESGLTVQELAKLKQPVAALDKGKEPSGVIVPETCLGKIKNWFRKHRTGLTDTAELLALAAVSGGTSYVGYCMLDNEAIASLVSFASGERAEEVTRKYGNAAGRLAVSFGLWGATDELTIRNIVPGHCAAKKFKNTLLSLFFNMYSAHTAINGVQQTFQHPSDQTRQALNIPNPVRDRLLAVVVP